MRTPAETVKQVMATLIRVWEARSARDVAQFFHQDATFQNVPLDPVRGREAIVATFDSYMAIGSLFKSVDFLHMATDGPNVLVERVDHFLASGEKLSIGVMAIFEVTDGQITAWREYFDHTPYAKYLERQAKEQ